MKQEKPFGPGTPFTNAAERKEYIEGIVEEADRNRKALGMSVIEYFEHCLARVKAATKQRQDPEAERGTLGCILLIGGGQKPPTMTDKQF